MADKSIDEEHPSPALGTTSCEDERCPQARSDKVWYCVDCSCHFCESCWRFQPPHKAGKTARDGLSHEKIDYHVAKRLEAILSPPNDHDEVRRLHEVDEQSTWFGWTKDQTDCPVLEDFGAYVSLMAESTRDYVEAKYPQLVSFVGETNAGKSTLINMLIKLYDPWDEGKDEDTRPFPAPVCGSRTDHKIPTSADVHLYADPDSFYSDKPLLYADCEGLNGGEEIPIAKRKKLGREAIELMKLAGERTKGHLEIAWADPKAGDPQRCTREFAVRELYPRLLYTFSDVVVFVSRNAKTFQTGALKHLLEWGHRSLEKSTNQPALPRAIVALNATEIDVDESEWDVEKATASLLESVSNALHPQHGVPSFQAYTEFWKQRGLKITSVYDLIRRYYGAFHVVTIPRGGRYSILQRQVESLRGQIVECCNDSRQARERARLRFTSEALQVYLQAAFKHFRKTIDEPFDFKKVSFQVNPIPANFGGRILELAEAVYASYDKQQERPTTDAVFTEMSSMVASCVLLDVHRHRKGLAVDSLSEYEKHFSYALEEFCNSAMPCSFRTKKGEYCVNVNTRHSSKGHQNGKGKIIGSGGYQSSGLNIKGFRDHFKKLIKKSLTQMEDQLQSSLDQAAEGSKAGHTQLQKLHKERMAAFYKKFEAKYRVVSHWACLCCLMNSPEHALPCAHTLCSDCAQSFGTREDDTTLTLTSCPLHENDESWRSACRIRLKPDFAGVRILSLDGGGIRGIIELEVLRLLQKQLGDAVPVQRFFDLIVGTSTGSIIALVMGVLDWSVEECIDKFTELCRTAFTKRKTYLALRSKVPATIFRGSMYKAEPLYKSLRLSLGEAAIFGGTKHKSRRCYDTKVAVTSTDEFARNAIIIANYNRQGENYAHHVFRRPRDPNEELRLWEAAAASAAAPPYFTAFWDSKTNREYLDGAFYNNNPARVAYREARLLWHDVARLPPDVLVSIGTGKQGDTDEETDREWQLHKSSTDSTGADEISSTDSNRRHVVSAAKKQKIVPMVKRLARSWDALTSRMKNIIDAEIAWRVFLEERTGTAEPQSTLDSRYIRLNPEFNVVPELDDVDSLDELSRNTPRGIFEETIKDLALHLIASTFYFKKTTCSPDEAGRYHCHGSIRCRFDSVSNDISDLRGLGQLLRRHVRGVASPYFVVQLDNEAERKVMPITTAVIEQMVVEGTFVLPDLSLHLANERSAANLTLSFPSPTKLERDKTFSISGFPRQLAIEKQGSG